MSDIAARDVAGVGGLAPKPVVPRRARRRLTLGPVDRLLAELAGVVQLTAAVAALTVRFPGTWWVPFLEQSSMLIRRCMMPAILSTTAIGFGDIGVQGGNFLGSLGTPDRLGTAVFLGAVREIGPFVTGMIVAGVGGTAICADLGARKVREELEALEVLAIDVIRELVVPRFLSLVFAAVVINSVAIVFEGIGIGLAAVLMYDVPAESFVDMIRAGANVPDLVGSYVKVVLLGVVLAAFACYKGLNVAGGAEGVGRAVNQAVVQSFTAIWIINFFFTSALLALFTEATQTK